MDKNLADKAFDNIEQANELTKSKVLSLSELMATEYPPQSWLVEKLIPKEGLVALSGIPGSFKSYLTNWLALKVATGENFFTFPTEKAAVLFIDRENPNYLIQKRFKSLSEETNLPIYWLNLEFRIGNENHITAVIEAIEQHNIKLVIIDSLIRIHSENENESSGMSKVFQQLKRIQDKGASVLFLHHHKKTGGMVTINQAESLRGSSDIIAAVDSHIRIDKVDDSNITLTQPKLRQAKPFKGFAVQIETNLDESEVEFIYKGEVDPEKEKKTLAQEDVLELLAQSAQKRKDIQDELRNRYSRDLIDNSLKELVNQKIIREFKDRNNNNVITYYLVQETETETPLENPVLNRFPGQETETETGIVTGGFRFPSSRREGNQETPLQPPTVKEKTNLSLLEPVHISELKVAPEKLEELDKLRKLPLKTLENLMAKGEQWFKDNPNASPELLEEKNEKMIEIVEAIDNYDLRKEAVETFTKVEI